MSDSFLDHLPSHEREKIRKRLRSPEAYERLRQKVKGPEDLEREMDRNEKLADLHMAMESEAGVRESVKHTITEDIKHNGIEGVLDTQHLSPDVQKALEEGRFAVAVESHPHTQEDALVVVAEGNVQEKIPVKQSFSEQYVGQFLSQK